MNKEHPKRLAIIGLPGSGKSTFAAKLGMALNIPVHHLDRHMFEPGGKKKDRQELLAIEQAMVNEESWIVEGCSMSTLGTRFARADIVIYFHFSRLLCVWRVFNRLFIYDKALSNTGCTRKVNWRLLKYIWTFDQEKRAVIEELKKKYPKVDFRVFRSSQEGEMFLRHMEKMVVHAQ
jgi:adenylate kinase family enzyme